MQGRWEEAIHHFRTALKRRPHNPTLRYFVGMASEELGTSRDIEVCAHENVGMGKWMYGNGERECVNLAWGVVSDLSDTRPNVG